MQDYFAKEGEALDSDADSIDDDALRSVEAFSSDSSDDGVEFVEDRTKRSLAVSFRSKRTMNNRISGNISMAGTEFGGTSNVKDQAKLYRSM